eukprot:m.49203 g.49203  ORF g.49203 m.49203 type:complete len:131 (+) comp7441_c0_seq2:161-553(+)
MGWMELPQELLLIVFSYLGTRDHIRVECVCRRWRLVSMRVSPFWRFVNLGCNSLDEDPSVDTHGGFVRPWLVTRAQFQFIEQAFRAALCSKSKVMPWVYVPQRPSIPALFACVHVFGIFGYWLVDEGSRR